jgi:hypothetical protein
MTRSRLVFEDGVKLRELLKERLTAPDGAGFVEYKDPNDSDASIAAEFSELLGRPVTMKTVEGRRRMSFGRLRAPFPAKDTEATGDAGAANEDILRRLSAIEAKLDELLEKWS